jgi:hypothetical protein
MHAANLCPLGQIMGIIKCVHKCGGVVDVKLILGLYDSCLTDCGILGR